jgi:hypothetical protein
VSVRAASYPPDFSPEDFGIGLAARVGMGKLTAEERRRAFQQRQTGSIRRSAGPSASEPAPSGRPARWAVIGIIGLALSFVAASAATQVVPPLSFNVSASFIDWFLPRTP